MLLFLLACAAAPDGDPDPADTSGGPADGAPAVDTLAGLETLGVRDVIFVHVDTLRADHTPPYGYFRDTLPTLAGRPALIVDGYRTAASWTLPTTASVFTGLDVPSHGGTRVTGDPAVVTIDAPTLAEAFAAEGRRTLLASGNDALSFGTEGFHDGFDTVNPAVGGVTPHAMTGLTAATLAWIDALPPGEPYFAFLQPMDVHGPYRPGEPFLGTWSDPEHLPFSLDVSAEEQALQIQAEFAAADEADRAAIREALVNVYDETILTFDAGLAALLDGLEARGRLDDTLVVIANDHGETLFDDPNLVTVGHGSTVREELVRGVLLVLHPRLASTRVACPSTSADLAPTLLRALGLPPMEAVDGVPLQEVCRDLLFSSLFEPNAAEVLTTELVVSDLRYSVRWRCTAGVEERYDLATDPRGIDPLPADAIEGLPRYTDALAAYAAVLQDRLGASACVVAR